jgi:cytochrome c biogenesis protein CcmG/thiol:disulfide interchange protein DsbE
VKRRRTALWLSVTVGVVASLFIGLLATRDSAADRIAPSRLLGRPAPDVSGPALDGSRFSLAALQGRYVVVNFFATWCIPCEKEHPHLVRFAEGGAAEVVSVIYDDSLPNVRRFFAERGGDWPVVDDPGAKVDWGLRGVPESFLVGPDGTVLSRVLGGVTQAGLEGLVARAKAPSR